MAANLKDYVPNLPQAPVSYDFSIFSGYLDIPNSKGKSLHYVFLESQNDPKTDPLILWLNGGPGCSSMDGLFYEHGPFLFIGEGLNLTENAYSWNTNASVIYLESPAGVGYSLLGNASNTTDDQITAHDNLQALLQFFAEFPEYKQNDFYIMGESYAGIYVPTLAYNVIAYNQATSRDTINLVGIAVGNGITDWNYEPDASRVLMATTHSLTEYGFLQNYTTSCADTSSLACEVALDYFYGYILNNINIYDIYSDCVPGPSTLRRGPRLEKYRTTVNPDTIPTCADWLGLVTYMTNDTVRQAMHIPASAPTWQFCSDTINYVSDEEHGSIYTYPYLIASRIKILIYSGDVDLAVPFTGTREWIANLNLTATTDFVPWYYGGQVAGFVQQYAGLTFATVRGAGHTVPQDNPPVAHKMIYDFINS